MDELLPHYERELAFLRSQSGAFARRYPKIAGRLQLTGDVGEDPHLFFVEQDIAFGGFVSVDQLINCKQRGELSCGRQQFQF